MFSLHRRGSEFFRAYPEIAELDQVGIAELENEVQASAQRLHALAAMGYEVESGEALLDKIRGIATGDASRGRPEYKVRVLAGLIALRKMLFLAVTRNRASLTVRARHLVDPDLGTPSVSGIEIQVLYLLHGHEEEDPGTTGPAGLAFTLQGVATGALWPRFRFTPPPQGYVSKTNAPISDTEVIEVHAFDPREGTHAFVAV
jgi:hypothetical protein